MTNTDSKTPTHEEIAARAYQLWEANGRTPGHDQEYWYQAIAHLTANKPTGIAQAKREAVPATTAAPSPATPATPPKTEGPKKRKTENQPGKRQPAFV